MWLLSIFSTNTYTPFPSDMSFATAGPAHKTGLVQVGDVLFEVDDEKGMSLFIFLIPIGTPSAFLSLSFATYTVKFWGSVPAAYCKFEVLLLKVMWCNETVHRSTLSHVSKHLLGPQGSLAKVTFLRGGALHRR